MKVIIEIASDQNNGHVFAPNREELRGRWSPQAVAHLDPSDGMKKIHREVGTIPGECIMVDTDEGIGRFFDPLAETPDGQAKWDRMNEIFKAHQVEFGGEKKLKETREFELNPDQVKEWLHEMRRCVDTGKAEVFRGSDPLPSLDEIKEMPGKRRRDPFRDIPYGENEQQYVDIVKPKPGSRKPVEA